MTDVRKNSLPFFLKEGGDGFFLKTVPLNLIKKCPQCGEVWIKVSGCDG
jgi:hypothetical protein